MNNGLAWSDAGDFLDNALDAIGTNFQAGADSAAARAQYDVSIAKLVSAKADAERNRTQAYTKAVNTFLMGIVIVLILVVVGKYFLPRFLK